MALYLGENKISANSVSSNYAEGYEAGKQAGYDSFWDNFQYEKGAPQAYEYAFSGKIIWNRKSFIPKYDIVCGAGYTVTSMFLQMDNGEYEDKIIDLTAWLEHLGRKLDTSRAWFFNSMFQTCYLQRIPEINMTSARGADYMFNSFQGYTVDKLIVNEGCTWVNAFNSAKNLVNITFEGTIGKSISFHSSPLSIESMKSVIAHLKNYTDTTDVNTQTVKFTDDCWAALEADSVAPDGNTWRDYVETTLGWLT
jgi:hypothetical protein